MPGIVKQAQLIDRYGVTAVMGRDYLGAGEILQMQAAEVIVRLYHEMKTHSSWAEFKTANPDGFRFLTRAAQLAGEAGLLDGS